MRSLHFLSMLAFVVFIIIHTALVLLVHFQDNIRNIVFGTEQSSVAQAVIIAITALLCVAAVYIWASWYSLRHRRGMQRALGLVVDPVRKALLHRGVSKQRYQQSDLSSYFWVNGRPPVEGEFEQLRCDAFRDWRLKVSGLVEVERDFSLDDLMRLPKQTQITRHNCIQGWSGVAEWAGVPVATVLDLCSPRPEAKYLVFTSYQHGRQSYPDGPAYSRDRAFYEVIDMELARHPQTILAYEMNGQALPLEHGAPLRLRVETVLGYKMVKYLRSIELVADYSEIGEGQGGFREDVQFYGRGAEI